MTTTVQTPETLIDGPFGARLLIEAGDFSLVEHPIAPRTLAGPSHVHQHEDEYSYVLEGEVALGPHRRDQLSELGEVALEPCR